MKYTNREAAERIVSAICNALPYMPDKDDWKKLIDFTENQINRQTAQHSVHLTKSRWAILLYRLSAAFRQVKQTVLSLNRV